MWFSRSPVPAARSERCVALRREERPEPPVPRLMPTGKRVGVLGGTQPCQ